eukprot:gene10922-13361_t
MHQTNRPFLGVSASVTGRQWRDRLDLRAGQTALAIAQRHQVPDILARVLAGRGVEIDDVPAYLDPSIRALLPDPSTLTDMDSAVERIAEAVCSGEQVAVFGDYDVDGATATALIVEVLRAGGLDPLFHIPDRIFEGYGPNVGAIEQLAARGTTLLVTVDCGTTSTEPLAAAKAPPTEKPAITHPQFHLKQLLHAMSVSRAE